MQAKWQGLDMQSVYLDWAEALQDKSLGAINFAIGKSKECEHPPSQGSFVEFCRGFIPPHVARLEKLRPVDPSVALSNLASLKKKLAESVAKMNVTPES